MVLAVALFAGVVSLFAALGIENAIYGRDCSRLLSPCKGTYVLVPVPVFVISVVAGLVLSRGRVRAQRSTAPPPDGQSRSEPRL